MARRLLLLPEAVRETIARRYRSRRHKWLLGEDEWPMNLPLGSPDEREAQRQPEAVRAWVEAWQAWDGAGELVWRERRWRTLGDQSLPSKLQLREPASVVAWLGEGQRWQRANSRHRHFTARWPQLGARLARYFDLLAD